MPRKVVIKADGIHWHPEPNEERDAFLRQSGVSFVNHVTDEQLTREGWCF